MANAKKELLSLIGDSKIKCAAIYLGTGLCEEEDTVQALLKVNYNHKDYEEFLKELDFDYDDGYGLQELHGTIWFYDGSWAERAEYDGLEWWEHHYLPDIPEELSS